MIRRLLERLGVLADAETSARLARVDMQLDALDREAALDRAFRPQGARFREVGGKQLVIATADRDEIVAQIDAERMRSDEMGDPWPTPWVRGIEQARPDPTVLVEDHGYPLISVGEERDAG